MNGVADRTSELDHGRREDALDGWVRMFKSRGDWSDVPRDFCADSEFGLRRDGPCSYERVWPTGRQSSCILVLAPRATRSSKLRSEGTRECSAGPPPRRRTRDGGNRLRPPPVSFARNGARTPFRTGGVHSGSSCPKSRRRAASPSIAKSSRRCFSKHRFS